MGNFYAAIGVALAIILTGIGSAVGVSIASQAAAGVGAEDPDKFSKTTVLQLAPASQSLYGFATGFILLMKTNFLNNEMTKETGLVVLGVMLPIAIVGLISAIVQGRVCAAAINMVAKRPELNGLSMAIFVETMALFAFIVSILCVIFINV